MSTSRRGGNGRVISRMWIMLLCLLLLEESEGRHQSFGDAEATAEWQGSCVEASCRDQGAFLKEKCRLPICLE